MVQIIPRTPSIGETLGQALGGGAQGFAEQFAKSMSPEADLARQKSSSARSEREMKERISKMLEQRQKSIGEQLSEGEEGLIPPELQEQIVFSMTGDPSKAFETGRKAREEIGKRTEKRVIKERSQDIFDRYTSLIKTGYTGFAPGGKLTGKGRRVRAEYNTLGEQMLGQYIELLNKGQFPQGRFNYIKELVPSAWDTDATALGKLSAMGKELGLDPTQLNKYIKDRGFDVEDLTKDFNGTLGEGSEQKSSAQEEPFVIMETPKGRRKIPKNRALEMQAAGAKLVQ